MEKIGWFFGEGMWDYCRCDVCGDSWVDDAIAGKPERSLYRVDGEAVCEHCVPATSGGGS